jgi:peroxiredoxin
LVTCDRCHRKFASYGAILHHYKTKHSNVADVSQIQELARSENETRLLAKSEMQHHGPSRAKLAVFLILVAIAASVSAYVAYVPRGVSESTIGVGSAAPNFTLQDVSGGTFTLSNYRGKSNILLLFNEGLSCQPCLQQMHDLDGLSGQFSGMNVLVVSVTPNSVDQLRNWMGVGGPRYGMVLSDPGLVAFNLYQPTGTGGSMMTHTFLLINKAGMVIWRHDYGPSSMYVANTEILAAAKKALGM